MMLVIFSECDHLHSIWLLSFNTHSSVSAIPGGSAGNHFLEVLSGRVSVTGTSESHMEPNDASIVHDFFGKEVALLKVLCGKVDCHDAKSTFPVNNLVFFDKCTIINIPELEGRMLG